MMMTRESMTLTIHWTVESSTSCSISICHPDRLRLRGNLADIVMMSTMKVMMMVVLVVFIALTPLQQSTHDIEEIVQFPGFSQLTQLPPLGRAISLGPGCSSNLQIWLSKYDPASSDDLSGLNGYKQQYRKESVQKRANCPIFPVSIVALIEEGHQQFPQKWPCWAVAGWDISNWMITEEWATLEQDGWVGHQRSWP